MATDAKPAAKTDAETLRKKDIIEHLVATTALDGKQSRLAVNAMLAFLKQGLDGGKRLDLAPLGRINRRVQKAGTPEEKVVFRLIPAKDKPEGKASARPKAKPAAAAGK